MDEDKGAGYPFEMTIAHRQTGQVQKVLFSAASRRQLDAMLEFYRAAYEILSVKWIKEGRTK